MSSDLVLLHGVGLDHRMWDRCVPKLARNHQVRTPDLPGHGRAAPLPRNATLDDLAVTVAGDLPGPVHLIGFSLGALVAQQIALRVPDAIRSLVLVSSVAQRSPEQTAAVRSRLRAAEQDFPATAEAALQRWMTPAWQAHEPDLVQQLRTTLLANDPESYLTAYRIFAAADVDLADQLATITTPTLAITGAEDPGSTPEMSEHLAATMPHCHAVVLPEAKHLLPLEQPTRLCAEIRTHLSRTTSEHRS